ncbi:uncharacterized protein DUF3489 [Novosphingobium kunmingense]|uniref:Uncharacterized protein DUF3489 n=1 Tax=Novosphingobium kunmingense TaxID=1211806 RepID=A0A2N0H350_9SPHN|nr:DUF3489 domain-containing protein [Novosphingobium kunmingense]PKB13365.1 uncharacterized protein DUF3489 [Novosphingobium kunmingense]
MPRKMAREPKAAANQAEHAADTTALSARPEKNTKIALVRTLFGRNEGATLAELVEATGWLPHTARAALTGLKKKGAVLEKSKRGDVTCYRIMEVAE